MKKSFKKLSVIITAIVITFTVSIQGIFAGDANYYQWSQFRGNNQGVTDSKLPRSKDEISHKWTHQLITSGWGNSGAPVVDNDFVYTTAKNELKKINKENGQVVKKVTLAENIGFFATAAIADGKIFIPLGSGRIQAFSLDTLEPLWISKELKDESGRNKYQGLSPVIYNDGFIYMGVSNGPATEGLFYALSTADEDTTKTDEIKEDAWVYTTSEEKKGYYWSAGAIVDDSIVFAGEAGELVSHKLGNNDTVVDTFNPNLGAVRAGVHYDKATNRIFTATKEGYILSVEMNSDGSFKKESLISNKIGSDITSTPTVVNGRVYLGGGGISSSAGIYVLDSKTLELIYSVDGKIVHSQSSAIVTNAYSTKENRNEVYLYLLKYDGASYNKTKDGIYRLRDFDGNTTPDIEFIAESPEVNYNATSVSSDDDGNIYYRNDSGNIFAFGSKYGKYTAVDVENAINRLGFNELSRSLTKVDEDEVKRVRRRFNSLASDEQVKVKNVDTLIKAEKHIEDSKNVDIQVDTLLAEISKLPTDITLDNKENVNRLYEAYMKLPTEAKNRVTNFNILNNAKQKIDQLENDLLVKNMTDKINTLPELKDIVLDSKDIVNKMYDEFNLLSEENKLKVTNSTKLLESKKKIEKIESEVKSINDDIWNKINPNDITLKDKDIVNDLIARYEKLDPRDQKHIDYYDEVLEAKKKIDSLIEEEANKPNKPNKPGDGQVGGSNGGQVGGTTTPGEAGGSTSGGQATNGGNIIEAAKTGDNAKIIIVSVVAILALAGLVLMKKKKQ